MKVKVINLGKARDEAFVMNAISRAINDESRFKVEVRGRRGHFLLSKIRLKESKPWCGSHPLRCDENATNRKSTLLEGADWVEFNDRINDVLDRYEVSANIASAVCILRKEEQRRIYYGWHLDAAGNPEWNMDEDEWGYSNYCGLIALPSLYPDGTPGLYERV